MPYSLTLPDADVDPWRQHDELITTSQNTCRRLLYYASATDEPYAARAPAIKDQLAAIGADVYVQALMDLDTQTKKWIGGIIAGAA
jgi:hypothetical protein